MKKKLSLAVLYLFSVSCYATTPSDPEWNKSVLSFEDAKAAADSGNAYAQAVVSILLWHRVESR